MKSWKKRLKSELDAIVPAQPANVRCDRAKSSSANTFSRRPALWISAVAAVLVLAVVLPFVLPVGQTASACVTVELNPKVAFVTEKGVVSDSVALNEDADIVLNYDRLYEKLLGLPIDEAVTLFVDYSARLGFVDMDDVATLRVSGGDGESLATVANSLNDYFQKKGVYAVVAENVTDADGLASILGESLKNFFNDTARQSPFISQRQAEGLSKQQLQSYYQSHYLYGEVKNTVRLLVSHFLDELGDIASSAIAHLEELANYISDEVFDRVGETLVQLISLVWPDASALQDLVHIPQSLQEFAQKVTDFLNVQVQMRLQFYGEMYQTVREAISDADFDAFVQNIVAQYGSANDYWQNANN
ncbi:unknown [Corallococcus sp. CAG:1435]|nr:unknown [Corallococcus sp. CAG:1435]